MVSLPSISYLDNHSFTPDTSPVIARIDFTPDASPVIAKIDVFASNTFGMLKLVTL